VPWCESCEKNWTPTSLDADGRCPRCGEPVEGTPGVDHTPIDHKIPWHFWVGVAAAGLYLGWRLIQLVLMAF
jgi:predicted amidophosphoribosyltransferase